MTFALSREHEDLRALVRDFAAKEVAPRATRIDREHAFPWETFRRAAALDLLGILVPSQYGGVGLDHIAFCILVEEVARVCASTALVLDVTAGMVTECLLMQGSEEQKQQYLPALMRGERLGAFCLSEPESGSDAASLKTRAVLKGDRTVLNGTKTFITNGGVADLYIVFASTDPGKRARGITAFLVEKPSPGLSFSQPFEKLGLHGSATCQVILEDCEVPVENRLGPEGEGFRLAMRALNSGRVAVGAQGVGIAQGALDVALEYTRQREAFGRPVVEFQGLQFAFADMATQIAAARALTYQAAQMIDTQHPELIKYAAMAKLVGSEAANRVASDALLMLGGYGYMKEFPLERMLRDAKALQIYEGTNHIQRVVIMRQLLKEGPPTRGRG